MNMLQMINKINNDEKKKGWNRHERARHTKTVCKKYDNVVVWEDDKEWRDIKPANWDD